MRNIYTSIDIGTDKIKVVTVEHFNNQYNVLASSMVDSEGLKQGLIVDANKLSVAIKKCVKLSENKLGSNINKVFVSVPTNNIEIVMTSGTIDIKADDKKITGEDVFGCMQVSLKGAITSGMQPVTMVPIEYKIDKNKKVNYPLGKEAETLSIKSIVTLVPKKNVSSVVSVLNSIDIEVVDIVISSIANYHVFKNEDFDKKVVGIIDIGSEKTVLSVFNKGAIIKEKIISRGSNELTEDIVFNYKVSNEEANKIKQEFAVANRKHADQEMIYISTNRNGDKIQINQYFLAQAIENKLILMLENYKKEINNLTNKEIGYIMVTGAVTSMLGFDNFVDILFGSNSNIINIGIIGIRDNRYSVSFGTIKYAINKLELREKKYTMFEDQLVEQMLSTRKKIGVTGAFSKIFKIFE